MPLIPSQARWRSAHVELVPRELWPRARSARRFSTRGVRVRRHGSRTPREEADPLPPWERRRLGLRRGTTRRLAGGRVSVRARLRQTEGERHGRAAGLLEDVDKLSNRELEAFRKKLLAEHPHLRLLDRAPPSPGRGNGSSGAAGGMRSNLGGVGEITRRKRAQVLADREAARSRICYQGVGFVAAAETYDGTSPLWPGSVVGQLVSSRERGCWGRFQCVEPCGDLDPLVSLLDRGSAYEAQTPRSARHERNYEVRHERSFRARLGACASACSRRHPRWLGRALSVPLPCPSPSKWNRLP
jgi:hypothetical protein